MSNTLYIILDENEKLFGVFDSIFRADDAIGKLIKDQPKNTFSIFEVPMNKLTEGEYN